MAIMHKTSRNRSAGNQEPSALAHPGPGSTSPSSQVRQLASNDRTRRTCGSLNDGLFQQCNRRAGWTLSQRSRLRTGRALQRSCAADGANRNRRRALATEDGCTSIPVEPLRTVMQRRNKMLPFHAGEHSACGERNRGSIDFIFPTEPSLQTCTSR